MSRQRKFEECVGLPHDFDPMHCEADYLQHLDESKAIETKMDARSRGREVHHTQVEARNDAAAAAAALPAGKKAS